MNNLVMSKSWMTPLRLIVQMDSLEICLDDIVIAFTVLLQEDW